MKTTKEVRTLRQRLAAFGVGALCCVAAYAADAVNIESDMSHHIVEQPGPKRWFTVCENDTAKYYGRRLRGQWPIPEPSTTKLTPSAKRWSPRRANSRV